MTVPLGRLAEPAMWILVVLGLGPRTPVGLLDDVRAIDGPIGPGTLYGALARLERLALIERIENPEGGPTYRLTERGGRPLLSTGGGFAA